ncbi:hypothetical protein AK812_SmicGene36593 [Symbiodinium microadriaticum]|uniref:Uncharacterized protein n=1 Tax=Symbiodinium microadriaticum TaxID=2951 RepID=A0A1Q9CII0_SYMMI|nr:hypothetical protein AK812_SmicGene36593 [Symbiodinium microadriaticum]
MYTTSARNDSPWRAVALREFEDVRSLANNCKLGSEALGAEPQCSWIEHPLCCAAKGNGTASSWAAAGRAARVDILYMATFLCPGHNFREFEKLPAAGKKSAPRAQYVLQGKGAIDELLGYTIQEYL